MNEVINPAPAPKVDVSKLRTELDYLRLIEQHLSTIRQLIVFVLIINAVFGIIQLCAALAAALGIPLY